MQETLGWEDPLKEGMATHSSILTWRIPWTEEPGGLQSMGLQRVGHDGATNTSLSFFPISIYHAERWDLEKRRVSEVKSLSRVRLFVNPWTVAYQAPPSMGFSRQEYWSGLPGFLLQGIFPTQGSNLGVPHSRQTL